MHFPVSDCPRAVIRSDLARYGRPTHIALNVIKTLDASRHALEQRLQKGEIIYGTSSPDSYFLRGYR